MTNRCGDCGADLALVGRMHHCRPYPSPPPASRHLATPVTVAEVEQALEVKDAPQSGAERQKKWRQAHPEMHRERMREYMRKRRG